MEYPKINSLWKRHGWYFDKEKPCAPEEQSTRQSFILGDYACPEFANVRLWSAEEKIDGTNIRIIYQNGHMSIRGRTQAAQIPCPLLAMLQDKFVSDLIRDTFTIPCHDRPESMSQGSQIILFGEGYGPKIQKSGGNYRLDPGFILFDVYVDGWWLRRASVREIASKLGIPAAPSLGIMCEQELVQLVTSQPLSLCSITPQTMEGIVCRPEPLMLFRNQKPIMFKLKCKEFSKQTLT